MSARAGALSVAITLLAGCSTGITVTRISDSVPQVTGAPWNLPMTQFTITITRQIVKCGASIEGSVETLATAGLAIDPDQRYVLTSNGWFATSLIKSTLAPTGISTALNAESTDATGTVIANVIGTAAQIAVGAVAFAPPPGEAPPPSPNELCTPDVKAAVAELYPPSGPSLKKQVETLTADLAVATAKVALLTAQSKADRALKGDLVKSLAAQTDAQEKLRAGQARLAKNLKLTTDTQVVAWPLAASEFHRPEPFHIDDGVLDKWTLPAANRGEAKAKFAVHPKLYALGSDGAWTMPKAAPPVADVKVGVPVRLARTGRLSLCVQRPCDDRMETFARPNDGQTITEFPVLQLGLMHVLPTTGGHFKSESVAITLDASGVPTTIETAEKVAAAAALSATAKDAATQIAALPASLRAAELAKTQAKTNQINADAALASARATSGLQGQTSLLAAQTALINAQNSLETAQMNAGLQVETAGVTAQTALLSAQAALATAQANAQIANQTSAFSAQAALLNAEAAQLKAAATLAEAKANAP